MEPDGEGFRTIRELFLEGDLSGTIRFGRYIWCRACHRRDAPAAANMLGPAGLPYPKIGYSRVARLQGGSRNEPSAFR